jgi:hypothetical protein
MLNLTKDKAKLQRMAADSASNRLPGTRNKLCRPIAGMRRAEDLYHWNTSDLTQQRGMRGGVLQEPRLNDRFD